MSGALFFALGIFLLIFSLRLPIWDSLGPQEGFFPLVVAIIVMGSSVFLMLISLPRKSSPKIRPGDAEKNEGKSLFRMFYYAGAIIFFGCIFGEVGYLASSALFLIIILVFVEKQSWKKVALVILVSVLATYLIFVCFLGVPLPKTFSRFI